MGPIDDFEVLGGARHMGPVPKATVTGVKVSNGYVVSIWTPPKPEPPPPPPKEDGMTDDERLDHIVDALAAVIGVLNNQGAGGGWEGGGAKKHVLGTQEEMLKFLKENF